MSMERVVRREFLQRAASAATAATVSHGAVNAAAKLLAPAPAVLVETLPVYFHYPYAFAQVTDDAGFQRAGLLTNLHAMRSADGWYRILAASLRLNRFVHGESPAAASTLHVQGSGGSGWKMPISGMSIKSSERYSTFTLLHNIQLDTTLLRVPAKLVTPTRLIENMDLYSLCRAAAVYYCRHGAWPRSLVCDTVGIKGIFKWYRYWAGDVLSTVPQLSQDLRMQVCCSSFRTSPYFS